MMLHILLLVSPLEGCQQELVQIDTQIEQLEKTRDGHEAQADTYQDEGDRWQFSSGEFGEARRAWQKADAERQQAIDIQKQIEVLQARKNRILQFYPQLHP